MPSVRAPLSPQTLTSALLPIRLTRVLAPGRRLITLFPIPSIIPPIRALFRDARATPALLDPLEDTRVGRMPSQILLAGGRVKDEDGLEVLELWPQEEDAETSEESEEEEEDGPGPPH